ncbi:MAG: copper resistance protein CopA, partial [Deltaproteobacteria bacterium]|nr:copper resistance protein CopA [Deltaproteobacteria bacterium]
MGNIKKPAKREAPVSEEARFSRREVISAGVSLPLVLSLAGETLGESSRQGVGAVSGIPPAQTRPAAVLSITDETRKPLGEDTHATVVNGHLPGPELRFREGERFQVLVENRMSVPTTVHWHGMIVPNYMDGVPGLTQYPIDPGQSVYYEYPLLQSGTYWYHSHYEFQEQTGLHGPLIIEARNEPYQYDQEAVVFLSDWLNQSPAEMIPQFRGEAPMTEAARPAPKGGYPFPGEKPFNVDVNYPGYLLNGQSNKRPWTLSARKGDRIRFRLINGSTASFFRVSLEGHELELIAADGQPVSPIRGDNLVIGTAERYDFLVTLKDSGSFTLHAAALGTENQVVGVIHTPDSAPRASLIRPQPGPRSLGAADYGTLRSPYPTTLPEGPVKTLDIELGGVMKQYLWSINGEYYPEMFSPQGKAEPLWVKYGERVRMRLHNKTMMYHPMHLHGHFFRLLRRLGEWDDPDAPLKDTVAIGPGQRIDFEFTADNPGHWFFHCHNLYHL